MKAPTCRACGVTIQFGITDKGRRMPIDIAAADDGNVIFTDGNHVRVLRRGETHDGPRFHSHFETCPRGAAFRKRVANAKPPHEALAAATAPTQPPLL